MNFCGNNQLNYLLAKFLERGYYERFMEIQDDNEWHMDLVAEQPDVELTDCGCGTFKITLLDLVNCSEGECDNAARTLRKFLRENNIAAWCNYAGDIPDPNPWMHSGEIKRLDQLGWENQKLWSTPSVMGYTDIPPQADFAHDQHTACFLSIPDGSVLMFDLTAGQYGYAGGGIMVQRWTVNAGWERLCEAGGLHLIVPSEKITL